MAVTTFEFVLLDPQSNLKPGRNSLQIRSRCMQGRNKREGSRRSRKEGKKLFQHEPLEGQARETVGQNVQTQVVPQTNLALHARGLLAHPRFAGLNVQLDSKDLVVEAFAHDITNMSFSPFDCCVNFESIAGHIMPFKELHSDNLFLHSIMATGHALNDFEVKEKSRSPTQQTMQHVQNTLVLLRARLQNPLAYEDESIIHTVLNLAMLSGGYAQWTPTIVHLHGLQNIVRLNGGTEFLAKWPKLQFKLGRIDLVWCLSSGKDPFFTEIPESWQPMFPSPIGPSTMRTPPTKWGAPIEAAFADLQALSLQINLAARAGSRYDAAYFCSILASLQSRLLHLRGSTRALGLYSVPQFPYVNPIAIDVEDPLREFMRLTMLAFVVTTFKAWGNNMPFQWIGAQLAEIVPKILDRRDERDGEFVLWGLAVAGISVVSPKQGWFRQAWMEIAPGREWEAVRRRLMKVMWIGIVHDAAGEAMFDLLQSSDHE